MPSVNRSPMNKEGPQKWKTVAPIMKLSAAISKYQRKIGKYDKQSWERTVEKRMLRGFSNVPKKSGKLKTNLIDVDLLRGSTFSKTKPQCGMVTISHQGLLRVLFMPLYCGWWKQQTSWEMCTGLLILYFLQLGALVAYFLPNSNEEDIMELSPMEIVTPVVMMAILGIIHSQVVSTNTLSAKLKANTQLKRKRAKRRHISKSTTKQCGVRRKTKLGSVSSQNDFAFQGSANFSAPENLIHRETPVSKLTLNHKNLEERPCETTPVFHGPKCPPCTPHPSDCRSGSLDGLPASCRRFLRVPSVQDDLTDDRSDEARHDSAVQDMSSVEMETDQIPSDTELDGVPKNSSKDSTSSEPKKLGVRRRVVLGRPLTMTTPHTRQCNSSCESEDDTTAPNTPFKDTKSELEWGMTTNSDCDESYESDPSEESEAPLEMTDDFLAWDMNNGISGNTVLNVSHNASDRVSCTIWEAGECKKADLTVLDISSSVVRKVDQMPQSTDYILCGLCFALVLAFLPVAFRTQNVAREFLGDANLPDDPSHARSALTSVMLGKNFRSTFILLTALVERLTLSLLFFFLLSVAERTFKQRFLYAKLFSNLTSSRQAKKLELPHFRLNKVRNIKTWLSVRSFLKKHGPQRTVDVIVSATFVLALVLISILCVQFLKDNDQFSQQFCHWEVLAWSLALGVFLLRYMTLGAKINKKYRNLSVLLTEQINLYVQMEQKPHKKEGLILANNVLKLAAELLKELESPFKISGLSANPFLYNATKLVILSAFSAILTELLGFKLKLYKLKIK